MDVSLDQFIKDRKIKYPGRGGRKQNVHNNGNQNFGQNRNRKFMMRRNVNNYGQRQAFKGNGGMAFRGLRQQNKNAVQQRNRGMMYQMKVTTMMYQPRRSNPPRSRNVNNFNGFGNPRNLRRGSSNRGSVPFRNGGVMKNSLGVINQRTPTKLYISNLDYGVSDQDIRDLFGEFGAIRRSGVNFGQGGKSLGTAEVQFENRISAVKAVQKYNNVTLDGRAMKLEVAGTPVEAAGTKMQMRMPAQMVGNARRRVPPNVQGVSKKLVQKSKMNLMGARTLGRKGMAIKKKGGSKGMRGKNAVAGKKLKTPTQEQLDADLEAFTAKKA